ncbi:MAG: hypothetical protein ACYC6Y_14960 [Thermoguttaceae bacterium]
MIEPSRDEHSALRRSIYGLLIAAGIGAVLGRVLAVDDVSGSRLTVYLQREIGPRLEQKRASLKEQGLPPERIEAELARTEGALMRRAGILRPFLSANDRSRWCTLRALVEPEMWVAAEAPRPDGGRRPVWVPYAIDKVLAEPGWDTIDMVKHPLPSHGPGGRGYLYSSKPPLLPTLMAVPYWILYRLTGATLGSHPYAMGRTLLVIYNVVPLLVYLVFLARLVERFGESDWGRIFVMAAAVFGTFLTTFSVTVNNHLPGAVSAMVAIYAAARIWFDGERRLRYFAAAGLLATFVAACELPGAAFTAALGLALLWKAPRQTLMAGVPAALVVTAAFFGTNWVAHETLRPAYTQPEWYDYEYQRHADDKPLPSYWRNRQGVDLGEPSELVYAFQALIGHHGIFSLTPVWLLSAWGLGIWLRAPRDPRLRTLAGLIAGVTVVCLWFYLFMQPQENRNYGGMTAGLRWAFWFAPLWLVGMVPAADRCSQRRWTRGMAMGLLALSAMSASYPTWNPWSHPWLYNFLAYLSGSF